MNFYTADVNLTKKKDGRYLGSVHFWNNVIDEYTSGNYRLVEHYSNEEVNYEDGTPADVFFFENK